MASVTPLVAHLLPFSGVGGNEIATFRLAQAAWAEGFARIAFHLPGAGQTRDLFAAAGFPAGVYPEHYLRSCKRIRGHSGLASRKQHFEAPTGVSPRILLQLLSVRRFGIWWRNSRQLTARLRERGAGLVHCGDLLAGSLAAISGRMAGLPVVCHAGNRHDALPIRDRPPRLARAFARFWYGMAGLRHRYAGRAV